MGGRGGLTAVETDATPSIDGLRRLSLNHAKPNSETGELYLRYRVTR